MGAVLSSLVDGAGAARVMVVVEVRVRMRRVFSEVIRYIVRVYGRGCVIVLLWYEVMD